MPTKISRKDAGKRLLQTLVEYGFEAKLLDGETTVSVEKYPWDAKVVVRTTGAIGFLGKPEKIQGLEGCVVDALHGYQIIPETGDCGPSERVVQIVDAEVVKPQRSLPPRR